MKVFSIDLWIPRGQRPFFHPVPRWDCRYPLFAWGLCSGEGKKAGGMSHAVEQARGGLCINQQQGCPALNYWNLHKMCWDSFVDCVYQDFILLGMLIWGSLSGRKNMALVTISLNCRILETVWHLDAFPETLFIDVCLSTERQVSKGLWNFTWWMITAGDQKSCVFKTTTEEAVRLTGLFRVSLMLLLLEGKWKQHLS